MCFSAEASYAASALLLPAGALASQRAYRANRKYLAIAALPPFWFPAALRGPRLDRQRTVKRRLFSYLAKRDEHPPVLVPKRHAHTSEAFQQRQPPDGGELGMIP